MNKMQFLNIDLDIESSTDISPIVQEWEGRVSVHRHEKIDEAYFGSFETSYSGINEIVEEYVTLIEGLSQSSRNIWDNANKRDFDFGYESGTEPNNFHSRIESESIGKLAMVGGSVVVTIYPLPST